MTIGDVLMTAAGKAARTAQGFLAFVTNELRLYDFSGDAPKVRLGSCGGTHLALSANRVWFDANNNPTREQETALLQFKQDERRRANADDCTEECTIHLYVDDPAVVPEDRRMVPVLLLRHDGFTPLVPFVPYSQVEHGPSLQPGSVAPPETLASVAQIASPATNKLVSPDGRLEVDIQNADAPNFTVYFDGVALWSPATGVTAAGRALGWRG